MPGQQTMFTQTIIDLADRHTTLYHLADPPPASRPLPIGDPTELVALHRRLIEERRVSYQDLAGGRVGRVLERLGPGYQEERFWQWYLEDLASYYDDYPNHAWDAFLPLEGTLSIRVDCPSDPERGWKVSPVPRVLLLPSGWSTWISFLVTGRHGLADLVAFVEQVFAGGALRLAGEQAPLPVRDLFDRVGRGVRDDAFGGAQTGDAGSPDVLVVATVLSTERGSLSWRGLLADERDAVRRIIRPQGPPPMEPFEDQVEELDKEDGDLNFMVKDTFGRFIWSHRLLRPEGRNHKLLRCHHNNTFRSFVLAWHQYGLLQATRDTGTPATPRRDALAAGALARLTLKRQTYKSKSMRAFLGEGFVTGVLQ